LEGSTRRQPNGTGTGPGGVRQFAFEDVSGRGRRLHSESNLEKPRRRFAAATSKLPLIAIVRNVPTADE
jgi:hypothetical protein